MPKAEELKACPFCGGDAQYIQAYGVECRRCDACLPATFDEHIAAWNTRALSHSTPAQDSVDRTGLVEAIARATCDKDGVPADEIMPDNRPRWMDRIEFVAFVLAQASSLSPTEAQTEAKAFCNKCGWMGPASEARVHKRKDGFVCPYEASITTKPDADPWEGNPARENMPDDWGAEAKGDGLAGLGEGVRRRIANYKNAMHEADGFVSGNRVATAKRAEKSLRDYLWDNREAIRDCLAAQSEAVKLHNETVEKCAKVAGLVEDRANQHHLHEKASGANPAAQAIRTLTKETPNAE